MYNLNTSKKWQKISTLYKYIVLLPIAKSLAIDKKKSIIRPNYDSNNYKSSFTKLFNEASSNLQSPIMKRYQYLYIIQKIIPQVLISSKQDFDFIKERLTLIFQRSLDSFETLNSSLNNPRLNVFWEAVGIFRTTECDDLPYQFTNLMRGLTLIYHLAINTKGNHNYKNNDDDDDDDLDNEEDDDLAKEQRTGKFLKSALYLSYTKETNMFYLYMVISLFGMSDEQFRSLCTEHEHRLWVIFQKVILSIIFTDNEAGERYSAISLRFNA